MAAYYMNEALFDLPDAWFIDRTVTYLAGTSPQGEGVLLLIERRPVPPDKSFRQIVTIFGKDALTRYTGYQVLFEREVEVSGRPALDVAARWRSENGEPVYVRRIHFIAGETWLILTGEAPIAEREFCDAYVNHVAGSLQLRE